MTAKNPHSEITSLSDAVGKWTNKNPRSEIMLWLQDNRHLPFEQCLETVKFKLKDTDPAFLIHFAACSFLLVDTNERRNICKKEDEAERESIEKDLKKMNRHIARLNEEIVNIALEHFESEKEQRKNANKARRDKFETIEQDLKRYWLDNIPRDKRATDAAILLEKTDIFRQSSAEPKRSTVENYVRKWQKEN
ncbi:MAG: hypothetical protein NTW85_08325 [Methylococcales bacterium]|nr:hypothetical protein [Methylococcales bacterium]